MDCYVCFVIVLSTVVHRCVGASIYVTVRGQVEFFTSTGYPSIYNSNEDHYWFLKTENASDVVNLNVVDSDIEYSTSCSFDYVKVHDGSGSASNLIRKFCGTSEPSFRSSGRYLYVTFHTDGSIQRRGFNMTYWSTSGNTSTSSLNLPLIIVLSTVCGIIVFFVVVPILCHYAHTKHRVRTSRIVPASQARRAPWAMSQTTVRLPVYYSYNTPRTGRSGNADSIFYTNPGEALPDYRDLYPLSPPPPYSER